MDAPARRLLKAGDSTMNDTSYNRGPRGTFSDDNAGNMVVGGRVYSPDQQIKAGITGSTDRTAAEMILATTQAGADQTGGHFDPKAFVIFGSIYLTALLVAFSLNILGIPDTGAIAIQYFAFVTIATFLSAYVKNDSNGLSSRLAVVGGLVIAHSLFGIYHLISASFAGGVVIGLALNAARIAAGVGIIRGRASARVGLVALAVISILLTLFNAKFSAMWTYVSLFRSPWGFSTLAVFIILLFSKELRPAFK
jgi:hypothetical protein